MDILITPNRLEGRIRGIPSKSVLHRALICASLADGDSRIDNVIRSADIEATVETLRALGAAIDYQDDAIIVKGMGGQADSVPRDAASGPLYLECRESGSTLRFMIPVAAALGADPVFHGGGRLPERPLGTYFDVLGSKGIRFSHPDDANLPLRVSGRLQSGCYEISGAVSSQYITGLLLALPLCTGDSTVNVTEPFESRPYVDITISVMESFGVSVEQQGNRFIIRGGQSYRSRNYITECDWSQAAFWLCAGAIGGDIAVDGLDPDSKQGDAAILDLLRRFGANIAIDDDGGIRCSGGSLAGIQIDASQIPDIVPVLACVAAYAKGTTRIFNAGRLRFKESDRLESTMDVLSAIGGDIAADCDELIVTGRDGLPGGRADGHNDHRIVMALATAAVGCSQPVAIKGWESVSKSYPHFFDDYRKLGGKVNGIDLG